jgi:hypothetical protein
MSRLSTSIIGRTWDEWRHRRLQSGGDTEDFLLVTWDTCRHDTFERARTPVLDRHAAARRAWAMATYTLPAHQAMFNGFLPHVFEPLPFYNRYVQQLWRISHRNVAAKPLVTFPEGTVNIVNGFRRRGYATLGVAASSGFASPARGPGRRSTCSASRSPARLAAARASCSPTSARPTAPSGTKTWLPGPIRWASG